jgi:hypothetical protein
MEAGIDLNSDVRASGWFSGDDVRVVNFWRMRSRKRTLALMGGTPNPAAPDKIPTPIIRDVTDEVALPETDPAYMQVLAAVMRDAKGAPIMREVDKPYAEMTVCSGNNILEEPYALEISRVPEIRVPGWEVMLEGKKYRWGLVRFAKDPQRLHNYWRSILAEKMTQTPKAVWVAPKSAVAGLEGPWRNSHLSDDTLLIWNDSETANKPERVEPAQIEVALLGQAEINTQDLKDITNIHEANLGMPSNEVSRVAIQARQRVSDTGTAIYHDNLALAIEEGGRVINELIDTVYDAPRVIKIIGEDGRKEDMVAINATGDPEADITSGKYSVTVVNGPSTETKRIEARESMQGLANAAPQSLPMFMDLYIEAQDWPMADKIAERIRRSMPPGLLDPEDMTPEQKLAAKQQAEQQAQQMQIAVATAVSEYMKNNADAAKSAAQAELAATQAQLLPQKEQTAALGVASKAADMEAKNRLKAVEIATGDKG